MQDLEKLGRELFGGKNADALRSVANSETGKALEKKLDAAAVEKAARSGDPAQLKAVLDAVLSTEEGRALAKQLSSLGL